MKFDPEDSSLSSHAMHHHRQTLRCYHLGWVPTVESTTVASGETCFELEILTVTESDQCPYCYPKHDMEQRTITSGKMAPIGTKLDELSESDKLKIQHTENQEEVCDCKRQCHRNLTPDEPEQVFENVLQTGRIASPGAKECTFR